MSSTELFRVLHFLALFYMMFGLGGVIVPLYRGYRADDLDRKAQSFDDALTAHQTGLLPGTILVGVTGVILAGDLGLNIITTGWLVTLEAIYLVVLLVCIPLLATGLRKVHLEALAAAKAKRMTPGLEEALRDNVALVFSLAIVFAILPLVYLAVFRPY